LSVIVPVAVKACCNPFAMEADPGVTAKLTKVAAVTVSVTPGEVTLPTWAVIFDVPVVRLEATPELVMVATAVVPDTHVAELV